MPAITASALTVFATDTNGTSASTLPFLPTADEVVAVYVSSIINAGTNPNTPTLTGNNITYSLLDVHQENGANTEKLSLFVGRSSSPTNTILTANFAGQTQTTFSIIPIQLTGVARLANVVDSFRNIVHDRVSGTNVGINSTLADFMYPEANATLSGVTINRGIAITRATGFADAGNTGGGASSLQCMFKSTPDLSIDPTWTSGATNGIMISCEIISASRLARAQVKLNQAINRSANF